MRISRSGSMSGKMLPHAEDPLLLEPFGHCQRHICRQLRIAAKGTLFHHRILRIAEHIGIRSKIHRKAQLRQISSDDPAHFPGPLYAAGRAHLGHILDHRHIKASASADPGHAAPFFIHRQKRRDPQPFHAHGLGIRQKRLGLLR